MRRSPRVLPLAVLAATVAPTRTRIEPFAPGQLVEVLSGGAAVLTGAALKRNTDGVYAKVVVASADITAAADKIGQTAAAREADGDVSGDLTIEFGTVAGQIIDALGACADVAVAADNLTVIVMVNGVPYSRINDAAAPAPGVAQWGKDSDNNYTIVIGASTGADVLKVGTEIEVFIGQNIDVLTKPSDTATLAAGTALAAGVPEERYLGTLGTYTDTAGRSGVAVINHDVVVATVAAASLITITK
jgi:hypothetical protein